MAKPQDYFLQTKQPPDPERRNDTHSDSHQPCTLYELSILRTRSPRHAAAGLPLRARTHGHGVRLSKIIVKSLRIRKGTLIFACRKTRIKMKTFAIILLVLGIGYVLFLVFGVILCLTSSPEEKARLRREYKRKMKERQLRKYKRGSNRNYFWRDPYRGGPGITD